MTRGCKAGGRTTGKRDGDRDGDSAGVRAVCTAWSCRYNDRSLVVEVMIMQFVCASLCASPAKVRAYNYSYSLERIRFVR